MELRACLRLFEDHLRIERGRTEDTIRGYLFDLMQILKKLEQSLGRAPTLDDLTRPMLQAHINQSKGIRTRRRIRASIRSLFTYLMATELYTKNPAMLLTVPPVPERLPNFLQPEVALQLVTAPLRASPKPTLLHLRDAAILHVAYGGGLRAGSLAALTLDSVLRDVPKRGRLALRFVGKHNREQLVLLPHKAGVALKNYLNKRPKVPYSQIFLSMRRKPLGRVDIGRIVRDWGKVVGVKAWPHLLRHSCATHLKWRGGSLDGIRMHLGHRNVQTTLLYAHSLDLTLQLETVCLHPLEGKEPVATPLAFEALAQEGWQIVLVPPGRSAPAGAVPIKRK